jgi:hypothetical protein
MASDSTNMSLKKWDSLSDRFDYTELADNFEKIDVHDHTSENGGVQIPAGGLAPLSVATSNIQDIQITTGKIANEAVTTAKIDDLAVTTIKLADQAVTTSKLDPAVTEDINDIIDAGVITLTNLSGQQEAWNNPVDEAPLSNGWTADVRYYKDTTERVWVEIGSVQIPAYGPIGLSMFTLPVGYRPDVNIYLPSSTGFIVVDTNGLVTPIANVLNYQEKPEPNPSVILVAGGSFRSAA